MRDCDHARRTVYARRTFKNGTIHYCIQCLDCLAVVKTEQHNNRPWIRHDEIPTGIVIHDFDEGGQHDFSF